MNPVLFFFLHAKIYIATKFTKKIKTLNTFYKNYLVTVLSVSQYYLLWCFNIYTCLYFYVLRFLYVHLHFVITFWPYYPLIFGYNFCICVYMTYLL